MGRRRGHPPDAGPAQRADTLESKPPSSLSSAVTEYIQPCNSGVFRPFHSISESMHRAATSQGQIIDLGKHRAGILHFAYSFGRAGPCVLLAENADAAGKIQSECRAVINRREILIEWGDCDPATIVYFPRYFEYGDACTGALFASAGMPKPELLEHHNIAGIPLVDAHARFFAASRFGETLTVESRITAWGRSSFSVLHRFLKG